jgi:hypothetical protein
VRVQFCGEHEGAWILRRQDAGLAARRGTAVKNVFAVADQQRDQLRAFILDDQPALAIGLRLRDITT